MKEREKLSDKESSSLLEMVSAITKEVPEREWERVPADLSKNVDHYLYGSKRADK
jgi:flagellar biosynthesis/type III secretory pathway protein FliH